jgi:hypothetical protein
MTAKKPTADAKALNAGGSGDRDPSMTELAGSGDRQPESNELSADGSGDRLD